MRTLAFLLASTALAIAADPPARQMEALGRGLVAVPASDKAVAVSWRLLGTDADDIAFHVYRAAGKDEPKRLTDKPLTDRTHFLDSVVDLTQINSYFVRPVVKGTEGDPSPRASVWAKGYLSIPLKTLPGHTPNDASVGDLDGDGEFDIVLKQEMTPKDNSQKGKTGQTKLEAYKLDGTFLWRIDLGRNIREGAHYTQFLVYDFDFDGRAEVVLRTNDSKELRIYTTPVPTDLRLPTLCHDPQYRLAVAWQNVEYNQPPHPGYFLGDGMKTPPKARITVASPRR